MLRKKINTDEVEEIWNGDEEKKNLNTEYFGVGDLEVSNNDKYLGYSLDIKGSEYYTIFIRNIENNKITTKEISETSGGITFSLDDKFIFYSKKIKVGLYLLKQSLEKNSTHLLRLYQFQLFWSKL